MFYKLSSIHHTDLNLKLSRIPKEVYLNKSLYKYLLNNKRRIDDIAKDWNTFKKYTNPYEFIYTNNNSISTYTPISRAYFKMVEIIHNHISLSSIMPITTFHLAEGPGGFIEAFLNIRKNKKDTYYGMSLIDPTDKKIPGWSSSTSFLSKNPNVIIERGVDGTGDMFSTENMRDITSRFSHSMDICTGDGGFDFSNNYEYQEHVSWKLIFTQIVYAMCIQSNNGTFVLKIFDIFHKPTLELVYILTFFYENVIISKPKTSRPANSEKYIICENFNLNKFLEYETKFKELFEQVHNIFNHTNKSNTLFSILKNQLPYMFISKLSEINAIYGQKQLENMNKTFDLIHTKNKKVIGELKNVSIHKSMKWCSQYNVPYRTTHERNIFKPDT
jgi:hypothetical protein